MNARLVAGLVGVALLAASCSSDTTTRDDDGAIVDEGDVGVFDLQVGDCVNFRDGESEVTSLAGVVCDTPHDGQVFALFDLEGDEFPGAETVVSEGQTGCVDRFEDFIGIGFQESIYFLDLLPPSEQTWNDRDDREVVCFAVPEAGEPPLIEDLRGIAQ